MVKTPGPKVAWGGKSHSVIWLLWPGSQSFGGRQDRDANMAEGRRLEGGADAEAVEHGAVLSYVVPRTTSLGLSLSQ